MAKFGFLSIAIVVLFTSACFKAEPDPEPPLREPLEPLEKKITYTIATSNANFDEFEVDQVGETYVYTDADGKTTSGRLTPQTSFGKNFYKVGNTLILSQDDLFVLVSRDQFAVGFPKRSAPYDVNAIAGEYNYLLRIAETEGTNFGTIDLKADGKWFLWEKSDTGEAKAGGLWQQSFGGIIDLFLGDDILFGKMLIQSGSHGNIFLMIIPSIAPAFVIGTSPRTIPSSLDGDYVMMFPGGLVTFEVDDDELESEDVVYWEFELNEPLSGFIEEEEDKDWRAILYQGGNAWFFLHADEGPKSVFTFMIRK